VKERSNLLLCWWFKLYIKNRIKSRRERIVKNVLCVSVW